MRLLLIVAILLVSPVASGQTRFGFDAGATAAQLDLEARYDADLVATDMDAWLKRLSSVPHHAGSAAGAEVVDFVAQQFTDWGYETEVVEYEILLPTPKTRELELVHPTDFTASLREESLAEDPSTARRDNLLPPYNAFSIDGEVEAELVFVNYGIPEDYELLERYGIDVTGKIAIAKYGRSWRGIKPKLAAEKGAIGALIYSDPADDGYGAGDT